MHFYSKKIIGWAVTVLLALNVGVADIGYSQNIGATSHRLVEDDGQSQNQNYEYALRNGITVKRALERISQKENLILSYDSDLLNSTDEISVTEKPNSLDKAIQEVLSSTELEYKIMKTRHLVIYDQGKIGHLEGKVVDSESWDYLIGARLSLLKMDADTTGEEVEKVTYVDTTGRYDINNVKEGTYKLKVSLDGYEETATVIEISNKQTTQKIIELTAK